MRMSVLSVPAGLLLAASLSAAAFEGSIDYGVTTAQGKTHAMTLSMSGNKVRTALSTGAMAGAAIFDLDAHTLTSIQPAQKTYSVMTLPRPQAKAPQGSFSRSGATDTVAGYPVEEWIYKTDNNRTSLWLTDKLGRGFFQEGHGGSGFEVPAELRDKDLLALRVTGSHGFKMEATKVTPGPVDAALFTVPAGFTEVKGMGAGGALPPDMAERMRKAMQSMTPEQRAAMEKMMQSRSADGAAQ